MTTDIKKIDINEIIEIVTPFDEFEYEPLLNGIQGNSSNHTDETMLFIYS